MITLQNVQDALAGIDNEYDDNLGGFWTFGYYGAETFLIFEDEETGKKQRFSFTIREELA